MLSHFLINFEIQMYHENEDFNLMMFVQKITY